MATICSVLLDPPPCWVTGAKTYGSSQFERSVRSSSAALLVPSDLATARRRVRRGQRGAELRVELAGVAVVRVGLEDLLEDGARLVGACRSGRGRSRGARAARATNRAESTYRRRGARRGSRPLSSRRSPTRGAPSDRRGAGGRRRARLRGARSSCPASSAGCRRSRSGRSCCSGERTAPASRAAWDRARSVVAAGISSTCADGLGRGRARRRARARSRVRDERDRADDRREHRASRDERALLRDAFASDVASSASSSARRIATALEKRSSRRLLIARRTTFSSVSGILRSGARCARRHHRFAHLLAEDLDARLARERREAREHLVEHAAERVDVAARVDRLARDLLGRHVLGRAEDREALLLLLVRRNVGERHRDAEIEQLERAAPWSETGSRA